jgi:class 3 adenylate cyclase
VIFADVVHSMDIAAAVDKHLREITTGGCGEALPRHGRQVTGDCSLAVFRAPVGDGGPRNL